MLVKLTPSRGKYGLRSDYGWETTIEYFKVKKKVFLTAMFTSSVARVGQTGRLPSFLRI